MVGELQAEVAHRAADPELAGCVGREVREVLVAAVVDAHVRPADVRAVAQKAAEVVAEELGRPAEGVDLLGAIFGDEDVFDDVIRRREAHLGGLEEDAVGREGRLAVSFVRSHAFRLGPLPRMKQRSPRCLSAQRGQAALVVGEAKPGAATCFTSTTPPCAAAVRPRSAAGGASRSDSAARRFGCCFSCADGCAHGGSSIDARLKLSGHAARELE